MLTNKFCKVKHRKNQQQMLEEIVRKQLQDSNQCQDSTQVKRWFQSLQNREKLILYPLSCILYLVSCILYLVSCILYTVSCILYLLYCILYPVSCILYPVSCILYPVSCILYPVSCILYPVSCILYSRIRIRSPFLKLCKVGFCNMHTLSDFRINF